MATKEDTTDKEIKIKASDHESYGTLTIIALLIPLVGLIVGASYLTKDSKLDRKLGEHLIACSVFATVAVTIMWFTYSAFLGSHPVPVLYPTYQ
ncbi:MAG: hypothetical protein ABIQ04_02795 [Candidatus Saccharimonadales bacterium]